MSRRYLILTAVIPALVTILCFGLGFKWVLGLPPTYSSKATIAFEPRITRTGAFPSSEAVVLYASNSLGYLTSDATIANVAAQTGQDPKELADATQATVIPGTATIAIEVRQTSPQAAAQAANAFAENLLVKSRTSPTVAGEMYGKAKQEDTPSGPPRTILTVVVAIISVLLGLLVFTAMIMFGRVRMAGGLIPVLRALTTPRGGGGDGEPENPETPPGYATMPPAGERPTGPGPAAASGRAGVPGPMGAPRSPQRLQTDRS